LRVSRDDAGGFLLRDDVLRTPARRAAHAVLPSGRSPIPEEKYLVPNTRLVWVFAHAHRGGFDPDGTYLDAARDGHRFLVDHFRDPDHGGYVWSTDRAGRPVNDAKILYGQSFAIYAFVELARASATQQPLDDALALFRVVDSELHDDEHGGWREHAEADWSPLQDDARAGLVYLGRKSVNGVLHWLEAVSALYDETRDPAVRGAVVETLDLCRRHVFPADPASVRDPHLPDWTADPAVEPLVSYGHHVEYAWLRLRAEATLGEPLDWVHFHAYLDHTLRCGFDHERGGAFTAGRGDAPAHEREKVWWVQCELMVALTVALEEQYDERYARALAQTTTFVERWMTDPRDGVLLNTVEHDGRRRWARKSGVWKAGYHDVRAATTLVDAFAS
jgi:mannobiose 2-epimerase